MRWQAALLLCCLVLAGPVGAASLETLVSPGPLSAAHAAFATECSSCHDPLGGTPQAQLCSSCHETVGADIKNRLGLHGQHPDVAQTDCQGCHREHKGQELQLEFAWSGFSHQLTDFPLAGAHEAVACDSCHVAEQPRSAAPATCVGCHAADDPHAGGLGTECAACHTVIDWQPSGFEHAATGFPLRGGHSALACESCHTVADFSQAEPACSTCHANDDPHAGSLGTNCGQCHTEFRWQPNSFDHTKFGGFALLGGHEDVPCQTCHLDRSSAQLQSTGCATCHAEDDVHGGTFGAACESCHSASEWNATAFNHGADTGFLLAGAHQPLECTACHKAGETSAPPADCVGCHSPDPHDGQLGAACQTCHNDMVWGSDLYFDHVLSQFPLLGKHAGLACSTCHSDLKFHSADESCAGCHADNDVHAGSLGSNCESCHSPVNWRSVAFDHSLHSNFSLEGAHAKTACASCHSNAGLMQAEAAGDCAQCHSDPHASRFGSDCASCHTQDRFVPVGSLSK